MNRPAGWSAGLSLSLSMWQGEVFEATEPEREGQRVQLVLALIFLFLQPFWTVPVAGASERWAGLADPIFHSVNERGLPREAAVTAIAEDDEGFLWIGTQAGVARWDGYHFTTYVAQVGESGSLPGNYVRVLHADRRGRLWVGTSGAGLARFDRRQNIFISYPIGSDQQASVNIRGLSDDGQNGLWIVTDDGLYHLADPDNDRLVQRTPDSALPQALVKHRLNAVLLDRDGGLWAGGKGGLIRQRKGETGFTPVMIVPTEPEQPEVISLFEDGIGRIWVGTADEGAYVVTPSGAPVRPAYENDPAEPSTRNSYVRSIAEPSPGEIWLGTLEGIVSIDTPTGKARRIQRDPALPNSLPDDVIWSFHKDRSGSLWVGTATGLARRSDVHGAILSLFGARERAKLHDRHVQSIVTTESGMIWLGLHPGLQIIDATATRSWDPATVRGSTASILADANVFALAPGPGGSVYAGTLGGLFECDATGQNVRPVPLTAEKRQPKIFALFGEKDRLWIGDNDGVLWQLDFATGKVERVFSPDGPQRLTDPRIRFIRRGPDTKLWIGTGHGLNLFDPATHTIEQVLDNPTEPGTLTNGAIVSMLTDRQGRVWLGTFGGGGMYRFEGRDAAGRLKFRRLGVKEGLPNENVDALLEASDGRIWASTDEGLAVIDPDTLAIRALHDADDVVMSNFWVTSGGVTRSDELLFGGAGGLTIVRPDRLREWTYRPPIVLVEARIDGRSVVNELGAQTTLTIPSQAKSIAVEYSALDYSAPERNRYSYRLDGYDQSWIETDSDHRVATYTNLPHGDYVLRIRGTNREGQWAETTLTQPIRVLAAWYQTLWFKVAVGLIVLLVIAALVQARTGHVLRRQREIEKLREMHRMQELGQLAGGVAHDFNNLLGTILGFTQFIIEDTSTDDPVHGYAKRIQMASRRSKGVIQQILNFAQRKDSSRTRFRFAELARETVDLLGANIPSTIQLVLEIDDEGVTVEADYDQLSQALLNLVLNALDALAGNIGTVTISVTSKCDSANRLWPDRSQPSEAVDTWVDDSGLQWAAVGKRDNDRDYAYLRVSDTGSGIDPTVISRVFLPFFTTKPKSRGTGLGLSVVRTTVLANEGWLAVNSRVGGGTCFQIAIPSTARMIDETAVRTASAANAVSGRVLLVDDDSEFGAMLETALRRRGLSVDYTSQPLDALATLRLRHDAYDVVVTDQTMPEISGVDFVRAVRQINAALPCLVCTGYSEGLTEAIAIEAGAASLIQKPVDIDGLVRSLIDLLEARGD